MLVETWQAPSAGDCTKLKALSDKAVRIIRIIHVKKRKDVSFAGIGKMAAGP